MSEDRYYIEKRYNSYDGVVVKTPHWVVLDRNNDRFNQTHEPKKRKAKMLCDSLNKIEQLEKDKAELVGLCEAAGCPSCNGDGAYYDNHGEVCQCQWCYELAKHKGESDMKELSDKQLRAMDKEVTIGFNGDDVEISVFVYREGRKGMQHCLKIPKTHIDALMIGMMTFVRETGI